MKIALCSSYVPFIDGGLRNIVEWLESMLREYGHQVERYYLPFVDGPDQLLRQVYAYRWMDFSAADRVICFRPPAYVVPHPHKTVWFIHHMRYYYDLWDTEYRGFPDDAHHRAIRDALIDIDNQTLGEAKHIFTNSRVVADRLMRYNNLVGEVLYPPLFRPERFHNRGTNDEIVYIARIEHHKRQHLLVEAMRYTRTDVKLRICGACSSQDHSAMLHDSIASLPLPERVIFEEGWISEERKADVLADCLAAAYLPMDEDSYGYPSLEACHSGKPILTTTDAGGVLELVQDGVNGLITEPDPRALAEALDGLYRDRQATVAMGRRAQASLSELNISWSHVVDRILS